MRPVFILTFGVLSAFTLADTHKEPQYSKFQSNFYLSCEKEMECISAFSKLLSSKDIAQQKYEVSLYRLQHNGSDKATHSAHFYFKDAEQYASARKVFAVSPAMIEFQDSARIAGVENEYETLTTHSITSGDGRGTKVSLRWSLEVTDPEKFLPAWIKMTAAAANEPWAGKAYGLQTILLGDNRWWTHEAWVAFTGPTDALDFLENYQSTDSFRTFLTESATSFELKKTHMETVIISENED